VLAVQCCASCGATTSESSVFCGNCGSRQTAAAKSIRRSLPVASPGWFRDPTGKHLYRYWDGEIWTEHIYSDAHERDTVSIDSLEAKTHDGAWRASPGSLLFSFVGLVSAFGLSILFILPFLLLGHPGGLLVGLVLSEAGLWTGLFGTCVLTSRRYGTGKVSTDFRLNFRWIDLAIGFGAAIVARCFAVIVLVPFLHALRSTGNPDGSLDAITTRGAIGWTVFALVTCVGAPLFEELFFRGLLQGQLVERFGPGTAVVVTAIVFGAVHIANDPGIGGLLLGLSVGASGIVLGVVRHLTGRLGSSMATHAMFNAMAVALIAAVGLG
jgi:hypothetical protein